MSWPRSSQAGRLTERIGALFLNLRSAIFLFFSFSFWLCKEIHSFDMSWSLVLLRMDWLAGLNEIDDAHLANPLPSPSFVSPRTLYLGRSRASTDPSIQRSNSAPLSIPPRPPPTPRTRPVASWLPVGKVAMGRTVSNVSSSTDSRTAAAVYSFMSWSPIPGELFELRSSEYLQTKRKEASRGCLLEMIGMDCFYSEQKLEHIGQYISFPEALWTQSLDVRDDDANDEQKDATISVSDSLQVPPFFVLHFMFPDYSPPLDTQKMVQDGHWSCTARLVTHVRHSFLHGSLSVSQSSRFSVCSLPFDNILTSLCSHPTLSSSSFQYYLLAPCSLSHPHLLLAFSLQISFLVLLSALIFSFFCFHSSLLFVLWLIPRFCIHLDS